MKKESKLTSKGQITVPVEIRRRLGVETGDKLIFEVDGSSVRVRAAKKRSRFEKYRGIGNPGIGEGREAIRRFIREMRGE